MRYIENEREVEPFYPRDCSLHSSWKRTREKKNVEPSRDIARKRSTCDLERERAHPPHFEGSQSPAHDHVVLEGGFHSPRLSRSTGWTKRAWNSPTKTRKWRSCIIVERQNKYVCNESVRVISLWNMKVWINNWFFLFFYFCHTRMFPFKLRKKNVNKRQHNYRTVENWLFYKHFFIQASY